MQLTGGKRSSRQGQQSVLGKEMAYPESEHSDCIEGAEVLACLRLGLWSADSGATSSAHVATSRSSARAIAAHALSSDEELSDDEEYRPSKVRVIHTGVSSAPIILPRRSYTWRGASRRQPQQHPQEGAADSTAAIAVEPTASAAPTQQQCQQRHAVAMAAVQASSAPAGARTAGGKQAAGAADTKEGDKEWAALTTWLRMNLHNPRTAKKVVLFVGTRQPGSSRWTFDLNPALSWADVSYDTKLRLKDLLAETQAAFARKYPARPPDDWRKKSQKYKAPGSSHTFQVPLEQLVLSLHEMYERFEGAGAAPTGSSGSVDSALTAEGPKATSPTNSHCS